MKTVVAFFVAIVAIAGLASFGTIQWLKTREASTPATAHDWLHAELKITAAQHAALEPIEAKFAEQNRQLRAQVAAANHELALAIRKGRADAPEIAAAVAKIHMHMEELQKASIDHIFRMRAALSPEQGEKLLKLAEQGLDMPP